MPQPCINQILSRRRRSRAKNSTARLQLYLWLMALAIGTSASANAAWCQELAAFGATEPAANPANQRRSLSAKELEDLKTTRICNKSTPLVGGVEMTDADIPLIQQSLDTYPVWEREYRARNAVELPALTQVGPSDKGKDLYLSARGDGVSAKTIDLFAVTFLVKKLYEQGDYTIALDTANHAVSKYHLQPQYHEIDPAERGTYLTDETMGNAILLFETLSALSLSSTGSERFPIIRRYLDMRDKLLPTLKLFRQSDADEELQNTAALLAVDAADGKLGDDARDAVAAAWMSNYGDTGEAFVVLKGTRPTTIKIDVDVTGMGPPPPPPPETALASGDHQEPGRNDRGVGSDGSDGGFSRLTPDLIVVASVLTAEGARIAYRKFVDDQLTRYSTPDMLLFDIQRDEQGALITVAQPPPAIAPIDNAQQQALRTIRLSNTAWETLQSGTKGEEQSVLKQFIPESTTAALVAYTSPFVAREKTYRDLANSFSFRLQKLAPEAHVYRDPLSSATALNVQRLSGRLVGKG